jgi:hypothetical protein
MYWTGAGCAPEAEQADCQSKDGTGWGDLGLFEPVLLAKAMG